MKKVLVIGDSCRDVFVYCETQRLAPDVPVPVLNVVHQVENPGMAANVHRNISRYVPCDLLTNTNWHEATKMRYVDEKTNHMFLRVDSNQPMPVLNTQDINFDYEMIVVSDYNKGFISESQIEYICSHHPCVFVDTKKLIGTWARNAAAIKINDKEYNLSRHTIGKDIAEKIIHTMGDRGCEYRGKHYSVKKVDVRDVSGAGDSFMAALCVKYMETKNIAASLDFANSCAAEAVTHRGVTTI